MIRWQDLYLVYACPETGIHVLPGTHAVAALRTLRTSGELPPEYAGPWDDIERATRYVDALETIPDPDPQIVRPGAIDWAGLGPFTWTIEVTIAPGIVADGADLTPDRVAQIFAKAYPYSYSHEIQTRVLSAPNPEDILREQGGKP